MSRLCLFILLIPSLQLAYSQSAAYHPISKSTVWKTFSQGLSSGCICCSGICVSDDDLVDSLGTDTVINNLAYSPIIHSFHKAAYITGAPGSCNPACGGPTIAHYYGSNYNGAIRNDSSARKVYIIQNGSNQEEILYDFNLNVGDTVNDAFNYQSSRVNRIDSVFVNGSYRKRLWYKALDLPLDPSDTGHVAIIEGIGSTNGPFYPTDQPFETNWYLQCVKVAGATIYPSPSFVCNTVITKTEELRPIMNTLIISPNPARDNSLLSFGKPIDGTVLLLSLTGQVVAEYEVHNELQLNDRPIQNGIYFLFLTETTGRRSIGKLIISE